MKLASIIILLLFSQVIISQHKHGQCSMVDQSILVQRLLANRKAHQNGTLQKKNDQQYIPIKFHIVTKKDGTGGYDFSKLLDELCFTNQIFEKSDFALYIKDNVNIVNDDSLYLYRGSYHDTLTYRTDRVLEVKKEFGPNAVNVFITNEAGSEGVAGFNNPFLDFIVMRKASLNDGNTLFAHELGHFFSVQHPHLGWEAEAYDRDIHGDTVRLTTVGSDHTFVELMNKENCENSGDNICDTPPDYNFGGLWSSNCPPFTRRVWDANGDRIVTSQQNIMSYFFGCADPFFSPGQIEAMQLDIASSERDFLRSDYIPSSNLIEEELQLISPQFNERTQYHDAVNIEWSSPEYATNYYVKLRGGGKEFIYHTQDTTILIEDLSPRITYTLVIHPYNETGGCASKVSTIFKTGDLNTSTMDPTLINRISIIPNPLNIDNPITVQYQSDDSKDIIIELFSREGVKYFTKKNTVIPGSNTFLIETNGISTGLYFLKIKTPTGFLTHKVIIQ